MGKFFRIVKKKKLTGNFQKENCPILTNHFLFFKISYMNNIELSKKTKRTKF